MENNKLKKIVFSIFIIALFLRLFAVISQKESERIPRSDAKEYDNIAVNIVSGHGFSCVVDGPKFPTTRRGPVYPLFLSGIYYIFGHNYTSVRIIMAILGAVLCLVVFFLTYNIYNDKVIALISSVITVGYKPFISGFDYYGGPVSLYSEYFYMFIIGLTILTISFFIKKENKIIGALSGILIGLTILTRSEFVLYPILLLAYLFYISQLSIKKLIRRYFIIYFFIILTMAPWIIRNYIVYKKFIPLTTYHGARAFWTGNNSLARGGWAYPEDYNETIDKIKDFSDEEKDRVFYRKGWEEVARNPKRIPKLFIKKILVHWAPFEKRFELFNPFYAFVLFFGAIGILFFRRRSIIENILLIVLLSTTLTSIIIYGDPRYRYPYEPYLIIFAALAIYKIFNKLKVGIKGSRMSGPIREREKVR